MSTSLNWIYSSWEVSKCRNPQCGGFGVKCKDSRCLQALVKTIICFIDNTHTPTAHSECFIMIGMMNEHITAPIIRSILKHAYSKHKQTSDVSIYQPPNYQTH